MLRDIGLTRSEIPHIAARVVGAMPKPGTEPAARGGRAFAGEARAA